MTIRIESRTIHNDHVTHNGDTYRVTVTMRWLPIVGWRIGRITVIGGSMTILGGEHAVYDRKSAPRWLDPVVARMLEAWADR